MKYIYFSVQCDNDNILSNFSQFLVEDIVEPVYNYLTVEDLKIKNIRLKFLMEQDNE